jgi:flagellar biosynthesis protein FliQ
MEQNQEQVRMEFSPEILNNLNVTRKWTMFLSILGFIFLGLLLAVGLATSTFLAAFKAQESALGVPVPVIIAGFAVIIVIYFFSVLFLFRFSKNIRDAVNNHDVNKLNKAFKNLKTFFAYIGIILIIALSVYVIALIGVGSSVSFLIGM